MSHHIKETLFKYLRRLGSDDCWGVDKRKYGSTKVKCNAMQPQDDVTTKMKVK